MRELRLVRAIVGHLTEIKTISKGNTVTMTTTHNGTHHRGVGLTTVQACVRLLESLRGYPKAGNGQ